jgi:hypothetical protein
VNTLSAILLSAPRREALLADAQRLLEQHVAQRAGLRGVAWRSGLAVLQAARPGIVARAVEVLLPQFLAALEPLYREFQAGSERDFGLFLLRHRERAVGLLLQIADQRAAGAAELTRSLYHRFRGQAEDEAQALLPAFARLLAGYLG